MTRKSARPTASCAGLLDAENVRVRMDGMPRIEYTLDGEEQRLALPFLTADM